MRDDGRPDNSGIGPSVRRAGGAFAYALLTVAMLLWAGNIVLGRGLSPQIGPLELSFWRWLVASAAALPFAGPGLWRQRNLIRRHWLRLTVLSFLLVISGNAVLYIAVTTTTATNASLLNASQPMIILLLAWLLYRDPLEARQWSGGALALAGVLITATGADLDVLLGLGANVGDVWMLAAVLSFALYSLLLRGAPAGLTSIELMAVLSVLGMAKLAPLWIWETAAGSANWSWPLAAGVIYAGCFASVAGISAWNAGVAIIGASRAGLFLNLVPVFAALLGIVTLGESLTWFHFISFGCIALGMRLALRPSRR